MKHNGQSNAIQGARELEGSNRKKDIGHKVRLLLFFLLLIILLTLTTSSILPICFPSHLCSHICKNDHLGARSCKHNLSHPCVCRNEHPRVRPCKQDHPHPCFCKNDHLGACSCKCNLSHPHVCRNEPPRAHPCKQDHPCPHFCNNDHLGFILANVTSSTLTFAGMSPRELVLANRTTPTLTCARTTTQGLVLANTTSPTLVFARTSAQELVLVNALTFARTSFRGSFLQMEPAPLSRLQERVPESLSLQMQPPLCSFADLLGTPFNVNMSHTAHTHHQPPSTSTRLPMPTHPCFNSYL